MNINDLTIGQAKEISKLVSASLDVAPVPSSHGLTGEKVIVRASAAGVHYGELVSIEGTTVTLKNARRLWYWVVADKKGISLSDVADHGLSDSSKVCAVVPAHIILNAAEVIATSDTASKIIEAANVYRP